MAVLIPALRMVDVDVATRGIPNARIRNYSNTSDGSAHCSQMTYAVVQIGNDEIVGLTAPAPNDDAHRNFAVPVAGGTPRLR